MERKIGDIFEYNGEWYQCVEGNCAYCSLKDEACEQRIINDVCKLNRIFKKLEKVGEPVTVKGRTFQKLTSDNNSCKECVFNVPNKACCKNSYIEGICDDNGFWIKIKQNKEDMEEKNKAEGLPLLRLVGKYMNSLIDYATFEKAVKDLYSILIKKKANQP